LLWEKKERGEEGGDWNENWTLGRYGSGVRHRGGVETEHHFRDVLVLEGRLRKERGGIVQTKTQIKTNKAMTNGTGARKE